MLEMQGSAREIAFDIVCADGTTLPVLVSAVLERGADGRQPVVRMAVFDAHDRREYERELLRAKERAEASEAHAQRLARTLQQTLIPPTPPTVPGLDVAAAYRPAGYGVEVGGDFYDVFQIAADRWVVAIGDVCGKGVDAAVVTALVRHTLRASSVLLEQPSASLRHLNDVLLAHETDRFCTVGLLRLQRLDEGWRVTAASAGHPLPLVLENGDSSVLGRPGSLLGVFEDIEVVDTERVLLPGQALLLYTDGVPDGRRGEEFYGEERLLLVAGKGHPTAADLTSAVLADLLAFQRGVARDDIAVLALRVPDQTEAAGRQA
jgi:sigma-B regulation protein RsbU (phosphoserine phosphatase)